uniref:Uncharacterized protein n=1 Tax=Anguilla anguilla TaxID=7936 RepID=A0A0E9REU3_ANGAN
MFSLCLRGFRSGTPGSVQRHPSGSKLPIGMRYECPAIYWQPAKGVFLPLT